VTIHRTGPHRTEPGNTGPHRARTEPEMTDYFTAMGKMWNCAMRNAESKMWNQKCGMTLIGRGDKPRDCWLSADYHTSLSTGSAVKCRPEVRKSFAMEADSVF